MASTTTTTSSAELIPEIDRNDDETKTAEPAAVDEQPESLNVIENPDDHQNHQNDETLPVRIFSMFSVVFILCF